MSMRDRRSAANMSPSLRLLGFLTQPDRAADVQELELDERDVVWSSSSPTSYSPSSSISTASSPSPTPSPYSNGQRWPLSSSSSSRGFPSGGAGLSALIADEDGRSPTAAIPAAARREKQRHPQPFHQSAPVAVPAWSKATADRRRREAEQEAAEEDYDEDDDEPVVPPHEMAARRAAAAASVMEGAGRTLKGRDLRRMRNAVWRTTGFLDL
ncbi:uncharacterized protein LOC124678416 [Lolium rigidum]|uniref:uncharacterized protein LOC124678416 n=1 Tax=Lolium rigidum TaxID=89674 RepID=UPI001F5D21A2|nr:uncharacterized protein LOC124678416 [Lolium rigidum]